MKKILSLMLALCMLLCMFSYAFATEGDAPEVVVEPEVTTEPTVIGNRDAYKAMFSDYVTLYEGTYEPFYDSYVAKMDEYKALMNSGTLTDESYAQVAAAYAAAKSAHRAFYGDRVTFVTSRYDVPAARNLMRAQASAGDYDSAIHYCETLTSLIHARIGYLEGALASLDSVSIATKPVVIPPEPVPEKPLIRLIADATYEEANAIHKENKRYQTIDSTAVAGPFTLRCAPHIDSEIGTYVNEQYSWAIVDARKLNVYEYTLYLADFDISTVPANTMIDVLQYDSVSDKVYSGKIKVVKRSTAVDGVNYTYNVMDSTSFVQEAVTDQ